MSRLHWTATLKLSWLRDSTSIHISSTLFVPNSASQTLYKGTLKDPFAFAFDQEWWHRCLCQDSALPQTVSVGYVGVMSLHSVSPGYSLVLLFPLHKCKFWCQFSLILLLNWELHNINPKQGQHTIAVLNTLRQSVLWSLVTPLKTDTESQDHLPSQHFGNQFQFVAFLGFNMGKTQQSLICSWMQIAAT